MIRKGTKFGFGLNWPWLTSCTCWWLSRQRWWRAGGWRRPASGQWWPKQHAATRLFLQCVTFCSDRAAQKQGIAIYIETLLYRGKCIASNRLVFPNIAMVQNCLDVPIFYSSFVIVLGQVMVIAMVRFPCTCLHQFDLERPNPLNIDFKVVSSV